MQNFEDIEHLVSHMLEKLDDDNPVSVVADKDLILEIVKELLDYENVILAYTDIDAYYYDKEYIITLYDDTDTDYWYVSIEKAYDHESNKYFGTDGYILFHEDVNSKALLDIQNNEFILLSGYDWFVIGEDDETADETEAETGSDDVLTVNGKKVSVDEYNAYVSKFAPDKMVKTDDEPTSSTIKESFKINGKCVDRETFEKELTRFEDRYMDNIQDMLLRYCAFMDEWNDLLKMFY